MGQKGIKDIHHRKTFKENPRVGCLYKWEQESIREGGFFEGEKERKRLGFGE